MYSPITPAPDNTDTLTLTLAPSGWTYHQTNPAGNSLFVLYDLETETMWYPFDSQGLRGIAGPLKDVLLTELEELAPEAFSSWKTEHPSTLYITD